MVLAIWRRLARRGLGAAIVRGSIIELCRDCRNAMRPLVVSSVSAVASTPPIWPQWTGQCQ